MTENNLEESQHQAVLQFQDIIGMDDRQKAVGILQKYSWNLEVAVQSTFNEIEGFPSTYDVVDEPIADVVQNNSTSLPVYSSGRSAVDVHRQISWLDWLRRLAFFPVRISHATFSFCYHCFTEIMFFVLRIVFPRYGLSQTQPIEDVLIFKQKYEREYGTLHPTFYQGSYSQVLQDCKKELKFLLVYLHSFDHQDTPRFCQDVLGNSGFCEYVNGNMLFWACDVSSTEGYRVSRAVRERTYPFLAIVCLRDNRMSIIWRMEGYIEVDQVIAVCAQVIDENEPYLVAVREDRRAHSVTQEIRKEQDAAYLESLAIDQQKEEEKKRLQEEQQKQQAILQERENEKQQKIKELALKRENCKTLLKETPEPNPTDVGSIQIRIKLPNGIQLQRYFLTSNKLQLLYDFVLSNDDAPGEFILSSNYPKKYFSVESAKQTLEDCGITKSTALFIQNLAESSSDEETYD